MFLRFSIQRAWSALGMFSTRIMATSCCCYSFATCCCCCCYELERDLSLDHARRPPILSLASISSLVYTARLGDATQRVHPRDENQKKTDSPPRGVLLLLVRRLSTRSNGNTQFFLVRVGARIQRQKGGVFLALLLGGVGPFHFCFPYFFFFCHLYP